MKTTWLSLIGMVIFQVVASAQHYQKDTAMLHALNSYVLRYQHATLTDDAAEATALTHPEFVALMGGADKMNMSAQKGKAIREQYKMKFVEMNYQLPDSVLVTATVCQVAFPIELVMKFEEDGEIVKDRMMMLASRSISEDKWYFVTVPVKNLKSVRQVLKFLDPALVIPE